MSAKSLATVVWTALVVVAATAGLAFAQASTAAISGLVTDNTGAVLPGVTVTATQTQTGLVRTAVTNETGRYTLPSLPIGSYTLEAELQGFRTFRQEGVTLQVNVEIVIDPVMQLGDIAETVTVQGTSPEIALETRRLGVGTVVESEQILEIPLAARNVTTLVLTAGAAVQMDQSPFWGMATGVNIAVAGGQRFGVNYTLDGAEHTNRFDQTGMPQPFPEALQEFRVSTGAQDAGVGRASGASVSGVTKSGTNAFHGDLFYFGRHHRLNAKKADAAVNPLTGERKSDGLKRNQPGFAFGGPIARNRLFFFTGYQSTVLDQTLPDVLSIVPTQAILNGDWTAFNRCSNINWLDADFRAGTVSPARYSPAAVALARRLPAAQNDCGEVRWGIPIERHDKQSVTRIDFQHTASHLIFGRYMVTAHDQEVPYDLDASKNLLVSAGGGGVQPNGFSDRHHGVVAGNTWVINARTLNSIRFSYNRVTVDKSGAQFFNPQDVGINQWTSVDKHFIVAVPGYFNIGSGPTAKREMWQDQVQISNDLNLVRGAHQFDVGGTWGRSDVVSLAHTRGVGGINFAATGGTGNALGNFMLGRVDNIRQSMPSAMSPYQDYIALYGQDTWRATPKLTVNVGLRWEPYMPMVWTENEYGGMRLYNFTVAGFKAGTKSVVFPTAPAGLLFPTQNPDGSGPADFEGQSAVSRKWDKLAPRVGVAWDPFGDGQTSVRANYGIAYDAVELQNLLNTSSSASPWAGDTIHRNGTLDDPWAGFAGGNPFPYDWRQTPLFAAGTVFMPFDPDIDLSRVQSFSVGVQRQFVGRWLASATYLGTRSDNLWNTDTLNPSLFLTQASHPAFFTGADTCVLEGRVYTPCNQPGNIEQRRELRLWAAQNNPALLADAGLLGPVDVMESKSKAEYNGLLTSLRGGISDVDIDFNYTLSRCESDRAIGRGVGSPPNPNQSFHNPQTRDRGRCASDRRHLINLTLVAMTPQFDRPALRIAASNWRVSGIYRWASGTPLTILSGADWARTGQGGQTANQISDDIYLDESGDFGSQFLNRAAFATPALGSYGTTVMDQFDGFGQWSLDMALSRVFPIGPHRVEARLEAFNVFNTVRPAQPATSLAAANFGRVTSVLDPRVFQFAMKYVF